MDEEEEVNQYRGETSKNAFHRNKGHVAKWKSKKGSFMYDHIQECQYLGENDAKDPSLFKMDVVSKDRDPLRRILREAIRIRDVHEGEDLEVRTVENGIEKEIKARLMLLNSKREFHLPNLGAARVANIADNL